MQPNTVPEVEPVIALVSRRRDAKAAGLRHYFTGRPCCREHTSIRYASNGKCKICHAEDHETWRLKRTPALKQRDRFKKLRTQARRKGYAPAPHERDCPPRPDNGRCQTCGEIAELRWAMEPGKASLVLDHCHKTGAFRAWLCSGCNTRAGA